MASLLRTTSRQVLVVTTSPELELLFAQLTGIAAWVDFRRREEAQLLDPELSREQHLDSARRLEALRREQQALHASLERQMRDQTWSAKRRRAPRAVVAHHEPWTADRIAGLLVTAGYQVVAQVDNGADAVGVAVAEQPEVLVLSDPIAMLTAAEVVGCCRRLSPRTAIAVQTNVPGRSPSLLEAGACCVVSRQQPAQVLLEELLRSSDCEQVRQPA